MTELLEFRKFFDKMGIEYTSLTVDKCMVSGVPGSIKEKCAFSIWTLYCVFYFDKNGRYLGVLNGEEEYPEWEERKNG